MSFRDVSVCRFQIQAGVPSLIWKNKKLLLTRPQVKIIGETNNNLASRLYLQNYPNPFNSSTKIKYSLDKPSDVVLSVYDLNGRNLETLVNEKQMPGEYSVDFDARKYPSGFYLYELRAGKEKKTGKMSLIK